VIPVLFSSPTRFAGRAVGSVLGRLGMKANANVRGMAEGMESLGDAGKRRAFVHTARSVIDPRGQRVDARDRLYLSQGVPTMLMWGEHDRMIPIRHRQRAHELMPRSRFEVLTGAGHFSHNHDPERFVALLSEFIAETEPADLDEERVRAMLLSHSEWADERRAGLLRSSARSRRAIGRPCGVGRVDGLRSLPGLPRPLARRLQFSSRRAVQPSR